MTPDQWKLVKELFLSALEQDPPERASFLDRACDHNESVRAEVESLLVSHQNADCFIEVPASDLAAALLAEERGLLAGQIIGNFKVVKVIATGGMGEVYLADDLRLGRKVALKLLPPHFTADTNRVRRFRQEARATSTLNHPNIVTILEIGETDSVHFIATEFVDGETLRERIEKGPLTAGEMLDVATQVASALKAAHSAGIVHRDIKPENIMLRRDGLVKVLDFGLAKLSTLESQKVDEEQSTAMNVVTTPGLVMGTVAYMSPEQARGGEVDSRTDLWSLGVVLYEVVAGRTPFTGETSSHVIVSILEGEAPSLSHGPELPDELQHIIFKALHKNKATRYQSAGALEDDLNHLKEKLKLEAMLNQVLEAKVMPAVLAGKRGTNNSTVGDTIIFATNRTSAEYLFHQINRPKVLALAAIFTLFIAVISLLYLGLNRHTPNLANGGRKSIAVLPVRPIQVSNRDEIYEIGIPDSLISKLATTNGLVVSSLDSIRKYSDLEQDPISAGRDQKVDYVLASNYQLSGGRLKFTAQLIDVGSGQVEDTYSVEKDTTDVFALQEAIAADVGNRVFARLSTSASRQASTRGTTNAEAYRLYLQGKNLVAQRTNESAQRAVKYFEQAIELDPNFARAYAGMANAYHSIGLRVNDRYSVEQKAKAAIKRALELDSGCADAYAARGIVTFSYDWDFTSAERDLLTAIQLEPNNDVAHWGYALLSAFSGQFEKATTEIETALLIAPGTAMYERDRGRILYFSRRYDEAIAQLKRAIELKEELVSSWSNLIRAQEMKGDYAGAYDSFIKLANLTKIEELDSYQKTYEREGWPGVKRKLIQVAKLNNAPSTYYDLSTQLILVGERDDAFTYLRKAIERRSWEIAMLRIDPQLDPLRNDPRFDQLLKSVAFK